MKAESQKTETAFHSGWERYYQEQGGARAWNGVPDAYLLDNLERVLPTAGSRVIDIACGDGRNTAPFLGKNYNVISTDLSPTALISFRDRCVQEGVTPPTLIAGDFMKLGLIDEQFECVVCFNSISHFPSMPEILKKLCGLLSKGGKAIFNVFTPNDVAFGVGEELEKNKYFYKDTLFTFATETDVQKLIRIPNINIIHSETRRWEEPDHGDYRTGTHMHEACFFLIERT